MKRDRLQNLQLTVSTTTMRLTFILAGSLLCGAFAGCTTPKPGNVEVAPVLHWVITDGTGRHESHYRFKPCVVAQDRPFTLDFSRPNSFESPDTQRTEDYFEGVHARMTVTISNGVARVVGRCDYDSHLGVVDSYEEDDESLYGQLIRHLSTRFTGTTKLGHELRIGAGEDDNEEPLVCVTFRETTASPSSFTGENLDDEP
jgi:hypothetical protein